MCSPLWVRGLIKKPQKPEDLLGFFERNELRCKRKDTLFSLNTKYFNHTDRDFEYKFSNQPKQNQIFNDEIFRLFKKEELQNNQDFSQYKANIASSAQKIFVFFFNLDL